MQAPDDLSVSFPESLKEEQNLVSKHAPSPAPERTPDFKYRAVWRRAYNKIKVRQLLSNLGQEIQLFGANTLNQDVGFGTTGDVMTLVQKTVIVGKEEESLGFLCRSKSAVLSLWAVLYFALMMYTAFVMPFRLAFYDDSQSATWTAIDSLVNGLYFLDILITLNTPIANKDGTLITSRKEIFLRYLRSWLLVDLVACIPSSLFGGDMTTQGSAGDVTSLLRLLRLPRLYRLVRLTRVLKMLNHLSVTHCFDRLQQLLSLKHSVMKVMLFLSTVILALHLMSCLWFFVAGLEGLGPETWVGVMELQDSDTSDQYVASMYWAVTTLTTVGYGDIVPTTTIERVVSIIWMIFGLCFFSFTVSSLSSLLNSIDTKESLLSSKLAAIDEFADESHLSKELGYKLRYALRYSTHKTGFSSQVKRGIFNELPRQLRFEVALAMHHGAAKDIPFFIDRDQAFIAATVPFLNSLQVKERDHVYKTGEYADEVYFIAKGQCMYMFQDLVMKKLQRGSYFGETEVLLGIPRRRTVLAGMVTDLLSMSRKILRVIEEDFPTVFDEMRQISEIRSRLDDKMYARFQQLFGDKSPSSLAKTAMSPSDPQPSSEQVPMTAKEAFLKAEERFDTLEQSITLIKGSVDMLAKHVTAQRGNKRKYAKVAVQEV